MFDWDAWILGLAVLAGIGLLGWAISLARRDVSHVDVLWSLMFVAAAATYRVAGGGGGDRALLVLALVTVWGLRLALHIAWRSRGQPEDRRYRAIRKANEPHFALKSLYIVFLLQAALAWVISLPLLAAVTSTSALGLLDLAGAALWGVGFVFEAGGDYQLTRFKSDPRNRGRVLDSGLWRYTRHPNYFGDFCVWWGFFLIALAGGGWWSAPGSILMSVLLLRVSGVTLLEQDIVERRPAYRDYIERTNAFFPGPPAATP